MADSTSQSPEPLGIDSYFSPPVTPGYVSAEEEHYSDATEGMRDDDSPTTPSTPVTAPVRLEDGDNVPTPTKLSPSVSKLNASRDSPTQEAGTGGEEAGKTEDNTILLPNEDDVFSSLPITQHTEQNLKEQEGEDGGYTIGMTTPQEPEVEVETNVTQDTEAGTNEESAEASKVDEEKVAIDLTDGGVKEVSEKGDGIGDDSGDDFGQPAAKDDDDGFGEGFGDDFDDFGEAVEGDDGFDDFEGFEDGTTTSGFDAPGLYETPTPVPPPLPPAATALPVTVIDFDSFDSREDLRSTINDIVSKLYPTDETDETDPPKKPLLRTRTGMFLTERSESLWNQLVAPPPLQPPDWKRSRIRRLFLVSLGVPVDLDEILPASKQKKLVLPSTRALPVHLTSSSAPPSRRSSTDSAAGVSKRNRSKSRSRAATGSRAPSSNRASRADKNPPMPGFDEPAARILCTTSDLVLEGMKEKDLREHIKTLQELTSTASELLTWWLKKRDGAMGDKETFETVIESLVGYARKTRTGAR